MTWISVPSGGGSFTLAVDTLDVGGSGDTLLDRDAESVLALKGDGDADAAFRVYDDTGSAGYSFMTVSGAIGQIGASSGLASGLQLMADGAARLTLSGAGAAFLVPVTSTSYLGGTDVSADPSDPPNGSYRLWQSDGTGSGDDGDLMVKITDAGGTTKTITLVDFSAA